MDAQEKRFMRALLDHFDPLWWEVRMNANSRSVYCQVAQNLKDKGWIAVGREGHFVQTPLGEAAFAPYRQKTSKSENDYGFGTGNGEY